jgi:holo-[acyl-carrier protein] synthase
VIVGIGIDLVENERIRRALDDHGEAFERRVFTPAEIQECAGRADRVEAFAARFAAKEACLKALGTGWAEGLSFQQVEVVRGPGGKPVVELRGRAEERARGLGVRVVHVSLTHEKSMAAAMVVLEG